MPEALLKFLNLREMQAFMVVESMVSLNICFFIVECYGVDEKPGCDANAP
jgi:hypothetical protein